MLAQTLIAYLPVKDKIYMIEELENGLHPQSLETVIQSLSSVYDNTVILASHSPVVLRLSEPRDILCFSKTNSGAIDIVRGDHHPKLKNWKREVDLAWQSIPAGKT
jgi:predicted ATPase